MSDQGTVIATFAKNKAEDVVVRLDEFRGVHFVDVRSFADFDSSGAKRPTKKGVAVNVRLIPKLITALRDAETEARRRGLLDDGDGA